MGEVALDFPRSFVEFTDPADSGVVIRADVTWLTSGWTCIFGRGCLGIDASRPDDGCCVHGAHFADDADEERVRAAADRLSADEWQLRRRGRRGGVVGLDDEGARQTRVVDGACIFHNRAGFDGPAGCALHALALREGSHPLTTKPDVCWQLPIRRDFRDVTRPDGSTYHEVSIGEFDRRGWGSGGHELDWYCSGDPIAHVGTEPVLRSSRAELVALIGEPAYAELVRLCEARVAPHPASTAGQPPASR
jgi:hypothetical protein